MIRSYLKYRRQLLCFYALTMAAFITLFLLAELDMSVGLYGVGVCTFILCAYCALDMARFIHRVKALKKVRHHLSLYEQEWPQPLNALEEGYADIAAGLYSFGEDARRKEERESAEELEYYTMWMHQIKTPISAMSLLLAHMNEPQKAQLEDELFKIERYVEMALQYARFSGFNDYVPQTCQLDEVIRGCVKKYARLFIGKKLYVRAPPTGLEVMSDPKWLAFIIEQLLSNAAKYTFSGGVTIEAREGRLEIRDTGIGILPEDLNRVFEKGYTGYNGRVDARASGIGLYMVRKAAKMLGIVITLNSSLKEGTRVSLTFPGPLALYQ